MQLKYTIDIASDEPIMMLDSHIGYDAEKGEGINGADFAKEILYLDSIGKKRIEVRINSVGGSVMDGMTIYNAILKSQAKVDTYNVGICASIAGVIFQAGRNRIMADYSLFMMHNPSGGDKKSLDKIKESLLVMLKRKTGKSESELSKLMDKTTWLSATECKSLNLCDTIEESKDLNKPKILSADPKNAWIEAREIINSFKPKTINMKQITEKLGLSDDATIENIVDAINEISNKAENIEKIKKALDEAKEKCDELEKKYNELKKMKAEADEEAENKKMAEAKNKAETLVNDAIKIGKITNEASAHWVNLALSNYDTASEMIKTLSVSKQGVSINISNIENSESALTNVIAQKMINLQNKFNK